jgi:ABC-type nitrate/sulfonate/bicarbonate transport system substrate-binding protein
MSVAQTAVRLRNTASVAYALGIVVCSVLSVSALAKETGETRKATPVSVGVFPGGFNWPLWVVKDRRFDASSGLDIRVSGIRSSEEQMTGLDTGRFDLVMTGFDNVIAYGGPTNRPNLPTVVAFMGGDNGLLTLVGRPGLSSFADLKGKRIGVDSERTGYAFALYDILKKHGLDRTSYSIVRAGGVKQRSEALQGGSIDATLLVRPFDIVALNGGAHRIATVSNELGAYQGYVGAARRQWAIFNPRNKDAALQIYIRNMDGATLEQARQAYNMLVASPDGIERSARFSLRGAEQVVMLRRQHGGPSWSTLSTAKVYYDDSFYRRSSK